MNEVNKPIDNTPNTRCYLCKTEFYVHPQANINSPYVTDCDLHKPKCEHQLDVSAAWYGNSEWNGKCKKCGEFYR